MLENNEEELLHVNLQIKFDKIVQYYYTMMIQFITYIQKLNDTHESPFRVGSAGKKLGFRLLGYITI